MRFGKMKTTPAFFALLVIASSVAAQKVDTDFDKKANFSQYHTYMWLRPPTMQDPMMVSRVTDAINAQLQAKGWQLVAENADVGVVANGATQEKQTLDSFYDGFGGWRWRGWGGDVTTTVNTYTVGTLVVDLFDRNTKQIIFRGSATETLSDKSDKNAEKLNKAVQKMFDHFPPKG